MKKIILLIITIIFWILVGVFVGAKDQEIVRTWAILMGTVPTLCACIWGVAVYRHEGVMVDIFFSIAILVSLMLGVLVPFQNLL